jgi:hypothetical protein
LVISLDSDKLLREDELIASAKANLAHYKVPLNVIVLDAFSTTESVNGLKIQKTKLQDQAMRYVEGKSVKRLKINVEHASTVFHHISVMRINCSDFERSI